MATDKPNRKAGAGKRRLAEAIEVLTELQFAPKQRNETAAYTLLALLDLQPDVPWAEAQAPLRGITPVIGFVATAYGVRYAPNTRETIRDDAVKFFVEEGLLLRNPDDPNRPTNSGRTVYQIEPTALALLRKFGTPGWQSALQQYLASRESLKHEIVRKRNLARVPVTLPDGSKVALSPGGQNPLIKAVIEHFCPIFAPGGVVIYIGDTENKFVHLESAGLVALGVTLDSAAKIPDVIVHYTAKNWLLLIEAVTSAGPVDGKRRKELKDLFAGCKAGLVFVTAFENRRTMQSFVSRIAWESEVWISEDPEHMIHFNGERFLGPYPDVTPGPK
ncbi:BsuBI/PstI family type II restriction endonuclease [Luteolibacter luteus]|uniref:Restriction endonuclease n=1 Tax=Luteolibacter luteus TaxID=2728835 RepID=A0A858RHL7_9BACT|nr:BsuBI/PstI family type II restriction endonuclease [Luteolibacter luteus]QJE96071.1 restriction endonuclease [Luteolibacter luteus]